MRISFAAALLLAFSPLAAWAQEKPAEAQSPAPSAWTKERIESPPKRDIKFEHSTKGNQRRLPRPDVKLLEAKYVAMVKVILPPTQNQSWADYGSVALQNVAIGRFAMLFSQYHLEVTPVPAGNDLSRLSDAFRGLIEAMPVAERPGQEVIDYFTSEQINGRLVIAGRQPGTGTRTPPGQVQVTIELLVESPEVGERVAAGFLKILDWGVCRPVQLEVLEQRMEAEKALAAAQEKVEQLTKTISPQTDEVAQLARFSRTASGELTTLRLQLLVERTGIKARIAACEKLMAREGLAAARRENLEDERLKAEVELASVDARLQTIQATTDLARESQTLRSRQISLQARDAFLDKYAPPPIADGTVVIQPIEWQ